jgi:hypothetical protein
MPRVVPDVVSEILKYLPTTKDKNNALKAWYKSTPHADAKGVYIHDLKKHARNTVSMYSTPLINLGEYDPDEHNPKVNDWIIKALRHNHRRLASKIIRKYYHDNDGTEILSDYVSEMIGQPTKSDLENMDYLLEVFTAKLRGVEKSQKWLEMIDHALQTIAHRMEHETNNSVALPLRYVLYLAKQRHLIFEHTIEKSIGSIATSLKRANKNGNIPKHLLLEVKNIVEAL